MIQMVEIIPCWESILIITGGSWRALHDVYACSARIGRATILLVSQQLIGHVAKILTNQRAENARALVDNALCSNSNHGINNERHNTETWIQRTIEMEIINKIE